MFNSLESPNKQMRHDINLNMPEKFNKDQYSINAQL